MIRADDTAPSGAPDAPLASKPGERRLQILQTLVAMLENPRAEKVTTAALAARLDVSEAALYRHFASKAQMFEGLIEFIETTLFTATSLPRRPRRGAADRRGVLASRRRTGMTRVLWRRARQARAAAGADEPAHDRIGRRYGGRCGSRGGGDGRATQCRRERAEVAF
jgi:AcrR family transcriptional regulator